MKQVGLHNKVYSNNCSEACNVYGNKVCGFLKVHLHKRSFLTKPTTIETS